MNEIII